MPCRPRPGRFAELAFVLCNTGDIPSGNAEWRVVNLHPDATCRHAVGCLAIEIWWQLSMLYTKQESGTCGHSSGEKCSDESLSQPGVGTTCSSLGDSHKTHQGCYVSHRLAAVVIGQRSAVLASLGLPCLIGRSTMTRFSKKMASRR